MAGVAREASPFLVGIDCLEPLTEDTARLFKGDGVAYAGRYLNNLSIKERDAIWNAGLGIWLLCEAASTIELNASVGAAQGAFYRGLARALEVAPKVHVTMDLEAASGSPPDVFACCDNESATIVGAGYQSCLYGGAGGILTGQQEYQLPHVNAYARAASVGVAEPPIGFVLWQIPPLDQTVHGQRVDYSITSRDGKGRGIWLWYSS